MQARTTAEVRDAFVEFFAAKGCVHHPSASLLSTDPTTLFTVAGMSQFKEMFLGRGTLPFSRAVTCQKCMRTNDILNVGRTPRHHTFFEMLGNFSFNDYFKREAITWAWEFLTTVLGLDPARLWVSVHHDDDAAWDIWAKEVGFPQARMVRLGDGDNFWPADAPREGPVGPGGCCSEIFWDFAPESPAGGDPGNDPGDRFVEIWNLVFPQFNVCEPMVDGRYTLNDLGRTNIDTGAGLERLACVVQGKRNNFDTDVFQGILAAVGAVVDRPYVPEADPASPEGERNVHMRRIADHVRGITMAIVDGARPANTGAGYIIRRLIRRAVLDVDHLGVEDPCLAAVVPAVVDAMGVAYPEIAARQELVAETLTCEERQFRSTLRRGLDLLQRELARAPQGGLFDGDKAFRLYETYGFPREITAEILADRGCAIDDAAWQQAEEAHRQASRSKVSEVFTASALQDAKPRLGQTTFVGYDQLECPAELLLLEVDGAAVTTAAAGAALRCALDQTPFYAESGGQVADHGTVSGDGFVIDIDEVVRDEGLIIHCGRVREGTARPGPVTASVDAHRRAQIAAHHSATHLLHTALGTVLGEHVEQQGSKVDDNELRFDYNHSAAPSAEELTQVEGLVNDLIIMDHAVQITVTDPAGARERGAKALFGEKYGDQVRVVAMGEPPVSIELCGGCHVDHTGALRRFRIVRDEASAAGIRRLVAVAGAAAEALEQRSDALALACGRLLGLADPDAAEIPGLCHLLKAPEDDLERRIEALVEESQALERAVVSPDITVLMPHGGLVERTTALQQHIRQLRKELERQQAAAALSRIDDLVASAQVVAGVQLVVGDVGEIDGKALREAAKQALAKAPQAAVVLGARAAGKALLVALCSPAARERGLRAGALIGALAAMVGGGGGGRDDQAQAGGPDGDRLTAALAAVPDLVAETAVTT